MKDISSGLTLIEVVVVISVVGILVAASSLFVKEIVDLYEMLSFQNEVVQEARQALLRMSREVRQVNDSSSFVLAENGRLRFTDVGGQDISYSLAGTDLLRNANVLADKVSNLSFTYYNATSAVIPAPVADTTLIRRLDIVVSVSEGGRSKTLAAHVAPRNLGGL